MPDYATAQAELIREIGDDPRVVTKMATVQARSLGVTSDPVNGQYWASVVFDGSSGTAMPVKCFESVVVAEGDKVGVVRYGTEWIITGNYTLRGLADEADQHVFSSTFNTSSSSFVDLPDSPSLIVMKMRDTTLLRIHYALSLRVSSGVFIEIAASVTSFDGSVSYDQLMFRRVINTVNAHTDLSGWVKTGALFGGGYTITGRWRRASGTTETLTVDVNDSISMRVQEVVT